MGANGSKQKRILAVIVDGGQAGVKRVPVCLHLISCLIDLIDMECASV